MIYKFNLDEKMSIWYRHYLIVEAGNEQEAIDKVVSRIKEGSSLDTTYWGSDITEEGGDYLYETAGDLECNTMEDSIEATLELHSKEGLYEKMLWDNGKFSDIKIVVLDEWNGKVDIIHTTMEFVKKFGGYEEFLSEHCGYSLSDINYLAGDLDVSLKLTEKSFG